MNCKLKCRDCPHEFVKDCNDGDQLPNCPECGGLVRFRGFAPGTTDKELQDHFDNTLLAEKIENGEIQV